VSEQIRPAGQADVASMTALAAIRREQYARYQPLYWRPAADAQDKQRPYLASLVASDKAITLVSEDTGQVTGFLIATLKGAPPVYDPGGLTCQIDGRGYGPPRSAQAPGTPGLRAGNRLRVVGDTAGTPVRIGVSMSLGRLPATNRFPGFLRGSRAW
jgi:hypothetical protein